MMLFPCFSVVTCSLSRQDFSPRLATSSNAAAHPTGPQNESSITTLTPRSLPFVLFRYTGTLISSFLHSLAPRASLKPLHPSSHIDSCRLVNERKTKVSRR
jgi:hypothetical protein